MTDNGASSYHRFLQGDASALDELIRIYGDRLVRYAYLFVKNFAAAEDIMEESIATLIVKRRHFECDAPLKAFLYKVTRNKCYDYLTSGYRTDTPLMAYVNLPSSEDTEEKLLLKERDFLMYQCIEMLPRQYRDVIYLTYFEDFSVSDAAKLLKKNKKQVYNLLARAKSSLKEILIREGFENENL